MSNVTMSNIGQLAGVTKTTVSMVFRNRPGISQETRARVMSVARDLGYRHSPDQQRSGRVHHGRIGMLFIGHEQPRVGVQRGGEYLFNMLQGMREQVEQADSSVVLSQTQFDKVAALELPAALWRSELDGLLVRGIISDSFTDWISEQSFPCMLMDCSQVVGRSWDHGDSQCSQIHIGNMGAMEQIVAHLHQRGCERFATITGELNHVNGCERLGGLKAALVKRGLSLPEDSIVIEPEFDEVAGERGVATLLERGVSFDALVCQNDLIAYSAMQALDQAGIRVPEDVRVTGFDNMGFAALLPVPLTTIDPQPYEIGRLAARQLLDRIGDEESQALNIRMPTRLVARASSV